MPCPQFSIRTLLWLTLVAASFLGGMAFGLARGKQDTAAKIDYYEQDRAHNDEVLRKVIAENMELRERLGLPLGPALGDAADDE